MAANGNLAPIIIKKKKSGGGDGHHGGAWKVAYADFVTAMMAFFMLMWLLNATTEDQKKGLADYFSPTISISRTSGGGDGALGGESVFSENIQPKNGTGASNRFATHEQQARGDSGMRDIGGDEDRAEESLKALEDALMGRGGESTVIKNALKHIVTRITDEGLVIELFSLQNAELFDEESDEPTPLLTTLMELVSSLSKTVTNGVAIGGHVRSKPVVLANNPVWDLSARRASRIRVMMEDRGIATARMQRVTGHADREPALENRMSVRNDRVEIVLLR